VRAQQAAEKLAAELAVQRIKAAQAVHAAGPRVPLPSIRSAAKRPLQPVAWSEHTTRGNNSADPAASQETGAAASAFFPGAPHAITSPGRGRHGQQ
jgi:hypothetical protein